VRIHFSAVIFLLFTAALHGQRQTGELRLRVTDASGAPLDASVELTGQANEIQQRFRTGSDGERIAPVLPFGLYRVLVERSGFQTYTGLIEIRSEVPKTLAVVLGLIPVETTVQVSVTETLLNPDRTGATQQIGNTSLRNRLPTMPAREILSLVDMQPGWLLEANGVLHPRGAEYAVQYVVDGLPLLDNRSPVYAPMLDIEEFQSMVVRTGGYPAEYGRQLGGVVEVTTSRDRQPGFRGRATAEGGSFGTLRGAMSAQYVGGRNTFGVTGNAMQTDRYLDPPLEQNYTNRGSGAGFSGSWERDWDDAQRTRIVVRKNRAGFLVPNEELQQQAGQRQDRTTADTGGQIAYSHVLSPEVLFDVRGSVRDVDARLWSNPLSTPIAPWQSRGFRESYAAGSLSSQFGMHALKFGGDVLFRSIDERFGYEIFDYRLNGVPIFDEDTPETFRFMEKRQNREQSAFVQDHIRLGSLTIDAGIRWDHYRLITDESAASPRLAAAWQVPRTGLVLRASYDRAFQTPAIENLLLASSKAALTLGDRGLSLPVQASRGNFYEAGFAKSLFGHMRLDASYFRRSMRNFADDSLLLNTGVSFPVAFASAWIRGTEVKLDVPRWGPVSGFLSYTNMLGRGRTPVAGGLFLGDEAAELLEGDEEFPITQDQRNTARGQIRYQASSRLWLGAAAQYGSGLPVELDEGVSLGPLEQQYGPQVLERIDIERGRVRPSFSADVSAGFDLLQREGRTVRLQGAVMNITDRLNVINFSGLFSGTALAPRRWASLRLVWEF
jgi:hypothetical protein